MQNAALTDAWHQHGRAKVAIARDVGICPTTLRRYFNNSSPVPVSRRKSLEKAFDAVIDWFWYDQGFAAANGTQEAPTSAKPPLDQPNPRENALPPLETPENSDTGENDGPLGRFLKLFAEDE
ncbi:MAG: hypothetical protein KUG74_01105, partial [Rhodobacteraceae bacterium]|nr:hypothetical protein [Paracoccaceae bacterium]